MDSYNKCEFLFTKCTFVFLSLFFDFAVKYELDMFLKALVRFSREAVLVSLSKDKHIPLLMSYWW